MTPSDSARSGRRRPVGSDLVSDPVRAKTVVDLLARSRSVVVDDRGQSRTAAEVVAAGRELAGRLGQAGLVAGDRVAVRMANDAAYLDLLAAAAVGRFVLMAVNARFSDSLARSLIERSGARVVVTAPADLDSLTVMAAPEAQRGRVAAQVGQDGRPAGPDDRFAVFTTSGTTSAPKLVAHTQRSIAAHAGDVAAAFGHRPESVVLNPLPLCGVFGFSLLWASLAGHCRILMPTGFDPAESAALIEAEQVSVFHGTDDMFHRLLATDGDLSSIETSGYARFNSALDGIVDRCADRGVRLAGLYGMSEVQALYSFRGGPRVDPPEPEDRYWRPGGTLVSADAACRVVDGELQLTGPSLFEGYLADGGEVIDIALTESSRSDGWFRTGDLAEIDGPRSFEYLTRMGDVMRLGGFLVAPVEVESVLMAHDAIDQAQVVAVGLESGARPVAFVIPAAGASTEEGSIIEHCRQHLAKFKCPVRVLAVDAFPVTDGPNGVKIKRAELRRLAAEALP